MDHPGDQTKSIATGVFYGPQEGEGVDKTKEIYNTLETQILQKEN